MRKEVPYSIGKRDLSCENSWKQLNTHSYKIDKPTIFCFGGNATKTEQIANGMCKVAASLIGLKPKQANEGATYDEVDVVGVSYGQAFKDSSAFASYITQNELLELVDNVFVPLAVNENYERLSVEQAQRNFNQVTFFSHCYGATVVNQLISFLFLRMQSFGYSNQEILNIQKQITSISYAPMEEICNVSSIYALSAHDMVVEVPKYASKGFREVYESYRDGDIAFDGNYLFQEDENTIVLFTSNMNKGPVSEHTLSLIERGEDWRYTTLNDDNANAVSQILGYAMAESVACGLQNRDSQTFIPKPTLSETLESCQSILSDFKQSDLGISLVK
ncbi:MAG: hypothetical protein IJW32_03510 [Clostridia bacterium]|nr:hypothetical protein [Clostridia bacterium]